MMGAIIGDIVGSRFEFNNHKSKDFEFFHKDCTFTDDTVMTLAIAQAIMAGDRLSKMAQLHMSKLGRKYPMLSYGMSFSSWLFSPNKEQKPYNSYGNGAAMRVSPVAWAASNVKECFDMSEKVTLVTHNHPEGIKGAEAIAFATYLARVGIDKESIGAIIDKHYYFMPKYASLADIRNSVTFDESCQSTVPIALFSFLKADSFEDAIRNAVSMGGDSDTIAACTGAVAEAYFGIPEDMRAKARTYLDSTLLEILDAFEAIYPPRISA